ncbi:hypothetical protein [Kitasatospora sp. NPDC056273]|uniref:hypothetical protein n=1 Tax=Kitasatospora sp. NPDC056273 TaxID=3345769 RepID=UPI0035E0ABBA
MFAVQLTVPAGAAAPSGEAAAAEAQAALWACAAPDDGLEHVRARAVPEGVGLVLYVRAANEAAARSRARNLLARALPAAVRPPSGRR